jgi:hypothetical protein
LIDSNGTTCVLIHSDKGALVFEKIKTAFRHVDVDPDRLTQKAREMFFSVSVNPRREMFFSDLNSLSSEALFKKYFPVSWRHTLEKYIRIISFKIGIYSRVKKLSKRVLGVKEGVIRRSAYRRGSN